MPLLILMAAAAVEFNLRVIERLAGAYLNWKNSEREAWGTYWERESRERDAGRRIDRETAENARLRRRAESVASFSELLGLIPPDAGVPLSPARFVELYRGIPVPLREAVIADEQLSQLYWSGRWHRTQIWLKEDGLSAYIIDEQNRMLREVYISGGLLSAALAFGRTTPGRLDEFPPFTGRIFTGEQFMEVFLGLSPADRIAALGCQEAVLAIPRPLIRAGISPPVEEDGWGQIGFEAHGESDLTVTTYPIPASGVNRLLWLLNWSGSDTLFGGNIPSGGRAR